MKSLKILLLSMFSFIETSYCKELPVKFFINGKIVSNVNYYLISGTHAYLLSYTNNNLNIPDSLHSPFYILFVYKKFHAFISPYPDTQNLEIYFDNRLCHNLRIQKAVGRNWGNFKYLFKRKYLILYGNGMETRTFQSKNDYKLRYSITSQSGARMTAKAKRNGLLVPR